MDNIEAVALAMENESLTEAERSEGSLSSPANEEAQPPQGEEPQQGSLREEVETTACGVGLRIQEAEPDCQMGGVDDAENDLSHVTPLEEEEERKMGSELTQQEEEGVADKDYGASIQPEGSNGGLHGDDSGKIGTLERRTPDRAQADRQHHRLLQTVDDKEAVAMATENKSMSEVETNEAGLSSPANEEDQPAQGEVHQQDLLQEGVETTAFGGGLTIQETEPDCQMGGVNHVENDLSDVGLLETEEEEEASTLEQEERKIESVLTQQEEEGEADEDYGVSTPPEGSSGDFHEDDSGKIQKLASMTEAGRTEGALSSPANEEAQPPQGEEPQQGSLREGVETTACGVGLRIQEAEPDCQMGGVDDAENDLSDVTPLEEEEERKMGSELTQQEEEGVADGGYGVNIPLGGSNGGFHEEDSGKIGELESHRAAISPDEEEAALNSWQESERQPEDLSGRRGDAELEEQETGARNPREAEEELQELRRRREERRKAQEESEKRKQEEKEAREEEEKRSMREGIERRRAEAAQRRMKIEEENAKAFTCITPKGSALKIGDRAEFLNKSAQKSNTVKPSNLPTVSKIDDKLELYNNALQNNRDVRPPRPALNLPTVPDGIDKLKNLWEEGGSSGSPNANKESAHVTTPVSGLINDWLNKTSETPKPSGGKPADLKPVDVSNKRSQWENMSSAKTPDGDTGKLVTHGKTAL